MLPFPSASTEAYVNDVHSAPGLKYLCLGAQFDTNFVHIQRNLKSDRHRWVYILSIWGFFTLLRRCFPH